MKRKKYVSKYNKITKVFSQDIENRIINQSVAFSPFNTKIFFTEGNKRKEIDDSTNSEEMISKKTKLDDSFSNVVPLSNAQLNSKPTTLAPISSPLNLPPILSIAKNGEPDEVHHIIEIVEDEEEMMKDQLNVSINNGTFSSSSTSSTSNSTVDSSNIERITQKPIPLETPNIEKEHSMGTLKTPNMEEEKEHSRIEEKEETKEVKFHKLEPISEEEKKIIEQKYLKNDKRIPNGGKLYFEFPHQQSVSSVAFNKSESRFFTATKGAINIWNLNNLSKKPISTLKCLNDGYIRATILSNDEKLLLTCGETPDITLWDVEKSSPTILKTMRTQVPFHYSAVFQNDSKQFFTSMSDGKLAFWDLNSGKVIYTLSGHKDSASSVKICDENRILSASLDKTVRLWDCRMRKSIDIFQFDTSIFCFDYHPETSMGAVGMDNSKISMFNINKNFVQNVSNHTKSVLSLNFSKDGNWICSGGKDRKLCATKSPFGPELLSIPEPNSILSVEISPTGNFIGTASWENKSTVYKVDY